MEKLKIVSIGEVILSLRKLNDDTFTKIFISNEANILSMLDKEKFETSFLTIVPKNDFGLDNINYLEALNIDHLVIQKRMVENQLSLVMKIKLFLIENLVLFIFLHLWILILLKN